MLTAIHERKRREPVGRWVVAGLVCLALFQFREWWLAPAVSPDGRMFGYTTPDIQEFIDRIGPRVARLYAWSELTLDLVFPFVYGIALARLIARATSAPLGRFAIWLPALAAGVDLVENTLLACITTGRCGVALAEIASLVTRLKWGLLGLALLSLLPGALLGLWRARRRLVRYLPYVYLLRVSLLLALVLLLLPMLAMGAVRNALGNLFVLTAGELFWVAVAAVFASVTVLATGRIVLLHGSARFGVASPGDSATIPSRLLLVPLVLAGWNIAFALVASARGLSPDQPRLWPGLLLVLAAFGGALAAGGLVWLLEVVRFMLAEPPPPGEAGDRGTRIPDILVPAWSVPRFVHDMRVAVPQLDLSGRLEAQAGGRDRLPGYLDPHTGQLLSGHVFALLVFGALAALYALAFFCDAPGPERGSRIVALVYVLALLTLPTWALAAAAFFLDRHRVPVLVVPGVLLALAFAWPTDHFFKTGPLAPPPTNRAGPADLVKRLDGCRLTAVAASGGGIRAAGWAAQVLTSLQREVPAFTPSLKLVSAVSGGSVGTMYFVGAFTGPGGPPAAALPDIVELSMRSSLNDVAWGFAYPDLWRTFTPIVWDSATDRAWALEQAWGRQWPFRSDTLKQWRDLTLAGQRPAVAFNATIVETGKRLAIGTYDRPSTGMETLTFEDVYGTRDVSILTAARLSATFTYVTPVARARDDDAVKWHVADGGYQDNYGVATLVDWLTAALLDGRIQPVDLEGRPCGDRLRVAIVRIASSGAEADPRNRSWAFQVGAPIQVLLAIRTAGPRSRNEMELGLLAHAGLARRLGQFCFDYENDDSPLSWHLSAIQRTRIREAWNSEGNRNAARGLREFFEGDGTRSFGC